VIQVARYGPVIDSCLKRRVAQCDARTVNIVEPDDDYEIITAKRQDLRAVS